MPRQTPGTDDLEMLAALGNVPMMDASVAAKLSKLLEMKIAEQEETQRVKNEEKEAFKKFRQITLDQALQQQRYKIQLQDEICQHRHDQDGNSMIDVINTFSGPRAACSICGKEWSGNASELRKQLGGLYPKDTRISGVSH